MAVTIRLLGWSSSGLRCPDHTISLATSDVSVAPVSLIQMPNGTGKTTTLALLRAALSGEAAKWPGKQVAAFRKRDSELEEGRFVCGILYNDRRITFEMRFDFVENTVRYTTTRPPVGNREGFDPPDELVRFLSEGFVQLFVFDGELAHHLLNRTRTNAEQAVNDLFQVNLFEHMRSRVQAYWEHQTKRVTAREERGLSRRRNRMTALASRLEEMRAQERGYKDRELELDENIARLTQDFKDRLEESRERHQRVTAAEKALEAAKSDLKDEVRKALIQFRWVHALHPALGSRIAELRSSLDRAKLPESAAKEFFVEVAEGDECICGRPIDAEIRHALIARAERYLGSEEVAQLNLLKQEISQHVVAQGERPHTELIACLRTVDEREKQVHNRRVEVDRAKQEAVSEDPRLQEVNKRIQELVSERSSVQDALADYRDTADTSDDTRSIPVLEQLLERAETDLAEITKTLSLKYKRDILLEVLGIAQEDTRRSLSRRMIAEANERIGRVMPNNRVRIEKLEKSLVLLGQEEASVGETLAVGYSFLSTLFDNSEHRLPVVVDSPANPIDLDVRREIARLIPHLTKQFVAFTISTERSGFVDSLEEVVGEAVQHLTVFRRVDELIRDSRVNDLDQGCVEITQDGVVVHGREFFWRFQVADEERGAA